MGIPALHVIVYYIYDVTGEKDELAATPYSYFDTRSLGLKYHPYDTVYCRV